MGVLSWIVLGILAGWLAGLVTRRKRGGCLTTMAVGVIGALVGGALANAAGYDGRITDLSLRSVAIAALGATLLLLVLGAADRGG